MKSINVLHISTEFDYACGVSKYVYLLLKQQKVDGGTNCCFLTSGGDSLERLIDLDVKYLKMTFRKGIKNILFLFPNVVILFYYCRKFNIDIIHTHHRYPELLAVLISIFTNIKTVTTAHSLVSGYRNLSFRSNRIIAVSKANKEYLITNYNVPKDKIHQIYNFVDPPAEKDTIVHDENYGNQKIDLLFVGRLNSQKGIDLLIKAIEDISHLKNEIHLTVIGEYQKKLTLRSKGNEYISISQINPERDISYYYMKSNLVILPSRQDSFPYVMIEAGLHQKAVIGSNVGGIPEYIDHNYNGLLFKSGDYKDLAKQIRYCIDNREELKKMGEQNYKKALTYCTGKEYVVKLNSIYEELISNK